MLSCFAARTARARPKETHKSRDSTPSHPTCPPEVSMATLPIDSRVSSRTHDFIAQKHRMFIDGRFVFAASGKTFPVYNPATGEVMAYVPEAEAEDVDRAVRAARAAFDNGPWTRMKPSE